MTASLIPQANPHASYLAHKAAIDAAIRRVLDSGRFILGPEVRAFEDELARFVGVGHAVGTASGTDALVLGLRALGIGPGDEVITVSHTAVATVAAIEMVGATPVLVDIEPTSFTLDPRLLAQAASERTRAIIAVHLYGHMADLDAIVQFAKPRGWKVIEDCAQAAGAAANQKRAGARGDVGCFSFYPTKNVGALGDAGALVTDDDAVAERARAIREYGWRARYVSDVAGINSRLDELQAAVLRVKLSALTSENQRRAAIAARYHAAVKDHAYIQPPATSSSSSHAWHLYVVRCARRDALVKHLRDHGVGTLVHYPVPVHAQPAYAGRVRTTSMVQTDAAAHEVLSLPLWPELQDADVDVVCRALRAFSG